MCYVSGIYNLYKFGLNYGFIIQLKHGYGLVIAPEGDFQNCLLTEKFDCESQCKLYLKHNADFGLLDSVPDWKFYDITRYSESAADRISWLLEIIQEKDRAYEKMKCCANCQHCDETGYCFKKRAYIPDMREGVGCTKWDIWRMPED